MQLPALKCPICERLFGLLVGTGTDRLDSLAEPFEAICVHCEAISSFHKVAVQMVSVENPGELLRDD